jgi:sensor histidine kinase YesM
MNSTPLTYKPVSTLKLTLIVILIVSIVFPLLFAYINDEMTRQILVRELLFTPVRLGGITMIIYGVIQLTNKVVKSSTKPIRYFIEVPVIFLITYCWLVFNVQVIEAPIRHVKSFNPNTWVYRQYMALFMMATIFIFIFQSALNFYKLAQQKAAQAEQLQTEFAQVRLQALRTQVNPHFLFNSLSVLSSLVQVNPKLSEQFIIELSKAYRYILDQKELELVTLKKEIDFLNAYFFLLQIRFDQKIRLTQEVNVDAENYKLPPLTLQLLVENAVKHNKMSASQPLAITVKTVEESLIVENNVSSREQNESSTGIGLENIRNRYAMVTDKKIAIEKTEEKFTVTIPLLKS